MGLPRRISPCSKPMRDAREPPLSLTPSTEPAPNSSTGSGQALTLKGGGGHIRIPELLAVPGGRFVMGDDAGRFDEQPAHEVAIAPFLLGRYPVTDREYACYL